MSKKKGIAIFILISLLSSNIAFASETSSNTDLQRVAQLQAIVEPQIHEVDKYAFCNSLDMEIDQSENIDKVSVIEITETNRDNVLEYLNLNIDSAKTEDIAKIYTITYNDSNFEKSLSMASNYSTRIHLVEYNARSTGFKDIKGNPILGDVFFTGIMCYISDLVPKRLVYPVNIFANLIVDQLPVTGGKGEQAFYMDRTTSYYDEKYVQVLNPNSNAYMTILLAAEQIDHYIQFTEGKYSGGSTYSSISHTEEIVTKTKHYSNETWLRNKAVEYVEHFGFGLEFWDEW